jgi:MFS family permease
MVALLTNTFINDYVVSEDRGKATGIQSAGMTLGNIFAVSILYSITRNFSNMWYSFGLLTLLQVLWALIMLFIVTEPKILTEKEARH